MRALNRVVAILEAVAENPGSASTVAIASRVGLSLSTASRLMRELAVQGLLEREHGSSTYVVSGRLVNIVKAATEPADLLRIALPVMDSLRDATQETVSLHVRSGDSRVCIAETQSRQAVRRVVPLGLVLPIHYGATGQVLLAGVSSAVRDNYLNRLDLGPQELQTLRASLDRIQHQGWAMAIDSWVEGLSGLAARIPLGHRDGASLAVSGPSFRWTENAMSDHIDTLLAAAAQISTRVMSGRT